MNYYARRVAAITGAGSGIGRALAVDLARRGARLALSDQNAEAVADTARRCQRIGARVRTDTIDITDRQAMLDYPAALSGEFGRIDAVFCVAGVIHTGRLLNTELSDVDHVVNVNLLGTVNTAKAFLPHLISSGDGHLVTFSSAFGFLTTPGYSAYSASKFAIRGFSESLRQEMRLDGHPVSVTCVCPGGVRTPIMRNGRFAAGEDPDAVTARFDTKIARTEASRAASIILRGVERRRPQVLVGADAKAAWTLVRTLGTAYQHLVLWAGRRT
ncbi:SDR family NAD(P)-dependent oxidoreductase [Streptosporangium saharense]|uniref:Short-subunit dehydrogenase n=1 Tax=Streptosporangium saharense TaxID=1706840 RepID=A0A7W7VP85_9ACTN|nr:SDR family NAD(P)-dependent oxidoreductase [Streptosporangium saharense]MBB4917010.1 short-subunit dehydrogenase [Streptosporangium saharense]